MNFKKVLFVIALLNFKLLALTQVEKELIHYASVGDAAQVIQLLQNKVNINAQEEKTGYTALHKAVIGGHLEVIKLLLEQKDINPNLQCYRNKETPLHFIFEKENEDNFISYCYAFFKNTKTKLDIKDINGNTALELFSELNPNPYIIWLQIKVLKNRISKNSKL